MSDLVFLTLSAAVLVAINNLSQFANSLGARRILFWASTFYLIVLALDFLFEAQCVGGFWNPLSSCNPQFLYYGAYVLIQPIFLAIISAPFIAPFLLLCAFVLETQQRMRNR